MKIAGYEIVRELGAGGMATVYLAIQPGFEREVAFKVMSPRLTADPSFAERFLREAKIVARLSHPHIVAVYDVGIEDGQHYIAMEFHPNGDLAGRKRDGLEHGKLIETIKQIASALDFAHEKGYVHRDIKPGNVLFGAQDQAILTDFGIARAADVDSNTAITRLGAVLGTPAYMSPEQARGKPLDGRSDLYSLGIMFYELLMGKVPFEAENALAVGIKHISDPIPRLSNDLARYQTVLDRLLAKEPKQRFQRGRQLVAALELVDTVDVNAPTEFLEAIEDPPEAPKSRTGLAIAAAVVLLAAGGTGVWFLNGSQGGTATRAIVPVPEPPPVEPIVVVAMNERDPEPDHSALVDEPDPEPDYSARVNELLTQAKAALQTNRLTRPLGGSAIDYINQAIGLQPDNRLAAELRIAVGVRYYELAHASARQGEVDKARTRLAAGQRFAPGHPAEQTSLTAIALAEQARLAPEPEDTDFIAALMVAGKLGQARIALEDGKLANARAKFQEVLSLDPTNQDAKDGLSEVSRRTASDG